MGSPRCHTAAKRLPRLFAARLWLPLAMVAACGCGDGQPAPAVDLALGESKFRAFCSACHGLEGQGTQGGPPPLHDSPWVKGPERRIIRIVLHGVRGAIEVHDKSYNLEMPGFGRILKNAEIAAILSFVRATFGHGSPPIFVETVAEVRALEPDRLDYWTVEELLAEE